MNEENELRHKINGLLISCRRALRSTGNSERADVYRWIVETLERIIRETYHEKDWLERAREDITKGDYVGACACLEKKVQELQLLLNELK